MVISLSTAKEDGHARAHFPQSTQSEGCRLIRIGLSMDKMPSKAP
jgi:hypothetical protein